MATYTVKQGDTLSALARQYGTDVSTLAKSNNISNPNLINVGQSLNLPSPTPPAPTETPSALTPDQISNPPQYNNNPNDVLNPNPADTNTFANAFTSQDSIAEFIKQATASSGVTSEQNNRNDLNSRLDQVLSQLTQKGARQQELEANLGVNDQVKKLQELNQQMAERGAQFTKEIAQLPGQGRGITTAVVNAQTDRARRIAAVELGGLAAIASAVQGNLTLAQDQAKRTVDFEFAPLEQEIANIERKLEVNKENLTAAEQRRAETLQIALDERKRVIEEAKNEKLSIQNIAIQAAANNADNATLQKINTAKTYQEALQAAGNSLGAEFRYKLEQQKFENDIKLKDFQFRQEQAAIDNRNTARSLALQEAKFALDKAQQDGTKVDEKTKQTYLSTGKQIATGLQAITTLIDKVNDNEGFSAAVGAGFKKTLVSTIPFVSGNAIPGTKRADFESQLETTKSALTLPALEQMKGLGAMSEVEFNTVGAAIGALNTNMSEDAFKKSLATIQNNLKIAKVRNLAQQDVANGIDSVPVISPEGKAGVVSRSNLQESLDKGYTLIENF